MMTWQIHFSIRSKIKETTYVPDQFLTGHGIYILRLNVDKLHVCIYGIFSKTVRIFNAKIHNTSIDDIFPVFCLRSRAGTRPVG